MDISVELNAELNDIIERYESQITHITETEEVRELKQARNRVIVACLKPEPKMQDAAVANPFHGGVCSGMSAEAVQEAANTMLNVWLTMTTDARVRQLLILVANLAARLQEHTGLTPTLSARVEKGEDNGR